jgi:hypothetical protein
LTAESTQGAHPLSSLLHTSELAATLIVANSHSPRGIVVGLHDAPFPLAKYPGTTKGGNELFRNVPSVFSFFLSVEISAPRPSPQ